MAVHRPKLFSAHTIDGCALGADPHSSVVNLQGRHHHLGNLSIIDGSIFPTSVGANPVLPIYAMAVRLAGGLVKSW